MKKVIKFSFLLIIFLFTIGKVNALSVSKNNFTISKGENDKIELFANSEKEITRVEFVLVYSSYDVQADFIANGSYTYNYIANNTHKVSFGEAKSGKILLGTVSIKVSGNPKDTMGSINIHSAKGYTADGEAVYLKNMIVNVTVGDKIPASSSKIEEKKEVIKEEKKEETKTDTNLINKIVSKIVKIEIKKDIFEYTISIDKNIKELDLVAVAFDDDTKVGISSQKIDELEDGKIIITAVKGDIKQEYVINVSQKEDIDVTIDKGEFKENKSYKGKWILVSIVLIIALIGSMFFIKDKK